MPTPHARASLQPSGLVKISPINFYILDLLPTPVSTLPLNLIRADHSHFHVISGCADHTRLHALNRRRAIAQHPYAVQRSGQFDISRGCLATAAMFVRQASTRIEAEPPASPLPNIPSVQDWCDMLGYASRPSRSGDLSSKHRLYCDRDGGGQ